MADACTEAMGATLGRDNIVSRARAKAETLLEEYFDINDIERILVDDTNAIIVPSVRPTRLRTEVPTILPAREGDYSEYVKLLCEVLNGWANPRYEVQGKAISNGKLGVGMVVLEKTVRGEEARHLNGATTKRYPRPPAPPQEGSGKGPRYLGAGAAG